MKLSELIAKLTKEQKLAIKHMFDIGEPYFIITAERWFVGVHLYQLDHLVPSEVQGVWSCGEMPK